MDTPSSQSTREPLSVFVIPHSVAPHRWWQAKHYQCLLLWRKKKTRNNRKPNVRWNINVKNCLGVSAMHGVLYDRSKMNLEGG